MVASKDKGGSVVTPELSRELSLFHLTMMGLGMMIGAGVFVGMGRSIGEAGPGGAVLTFALNGAKSGANSNLADKPLRA